MANKRSINPLLDEEEEEEINKTSNAAVECSASNKQKIRRQKIALLIGYLGCKYKGYQKQVSSEGIELVQTVEGELEKALVKCLLDVFEYTNEGGGWNWSRAARTDKGVHAACQVVCTEFDLNSMSGGEHCLEKHQFVFEFCSKLVHRMSMYLPSDVHLFSALPVTKSFDARLLCDSREYMYVLPMFVLRNVDSNQVSSDAEHAEAFNNLLNQFVGSHNFHNFTSRIQAVDPTARRVVNAVNVEHQQLVGEKSTHSALLIKLSGQSFLLNQIRKMIALGIEVHRGTAPLNAINECLTTKEKKRIHMAPSEGLYLRHPNYLNYNNKRASPPSTPKLNFDEFDEKINKFEMQQIYAEIINSIEQNIWQTWLDNINNHPFDSSI